MEPPETATRCAKSSLSGLCRIRQAAKRDRNERFTCLLHHITVELLDEAFHDLKRSWGQVGPYLSSPGEKLSVLGWGETGGVPRHAKRGVGTCRGAEPPPRERLPRGNFPRRSLWGLFLGVMRLSDEPLQAPRRPRNNVAV